jgi:Uma2 family endonuclease
MTEILNPFLDHPLPWTEDEYLAMPEGEGTRVELIDGELRFMPGKDGRHQHVLAHLWLQLDQGLPDELEPVSGAAVRLGPDRIVIPDLVAAAAGADGPWLEAADVALVGEVVAEPSQLMDRHLRPVLFAEGGIPWYLRVELEPQLELVLYRLSGEAHTEHARAGPGERLELPGLDCSIEVDALQRRRG